MKAFVRVTALLLIFMLCLSILGGCGGGNDDENEITTQPTVSSEPIEMRILKLPYTKGDPLNPYTATSMINLQLSTLLYDCLFCPDANYNAIPVLADSYTMDGLNLTVQLKSDIAFSDGSSLTATDVAASFITAQIAPTYSARLSNFSYVKIIDATSVAFTLKSPQPLAVNCLTFPITKKNDSADLPGGSGRYTFVHENGKDLLNVNTKRLGSFAPTIKTIELVAVSDSDTLNYTLQVGNIDFFFTDLSNGDYRRINASSVEVVLNNLVYLGLNTGSAKLQTTAVRQAISLLIDKNALVATAFQGHASVAHTPFNPDFAGIAGYDFVPDTENAVALLEQAGYTKLNDRGIRYSGYSNTLDFKLLVNADNAFKVEAAKMIKQDLMKAGINVTLTTLDFEAYSAAIRSWKFDMYLGEMRLTPDMSLSPLLTTGGNITYGINTSTGAAASAYYQYKTGAMDTKEFVDTFAADVPFVPVCYRNGIAAYSRELIIPQNYTTSDIYFGIEAWTF